MVTSSPSHSKYESLGKESNEQLGFSSEIELENALIPLMANLIESKEEKEVP